MATKYRTAFRGKLGQKLTWFFSSQEFLKYFYNTGWMMLDKIVRLLLTFFVGVWLTRYLGPSNYGLYSYVLSFAMVFLPLASFGIDNILVKELVKNRSMENSLLGTAFTLKCLGSLLYIITLCAVLLVFDNSFYTNSLIILFAFSVIFQSFNVIDFYFQSLVKSKKVILTKLIVLILSSLLKVLLIITEAPLFAFIGLFIIDGILLSIGYLLLCKKHNLNIRKWSFNSHFFFSFLRQGWPLIISGFAVTLAMRIDQIMLKSFVEIGELGIYSVGVKIAEAISFIPMMISQSLFPKISSMDLVADKNKLMLLFRYVFYGLIGLSLLILAITPISIEMLYGKEFFRSISVIQLLIWTIPLSFLGVLTNNLLVVNNNQKIILFRQVILTSFNIGFNIILIPKLGIIGAAIATLIVDFMINLFLDPFFKSTRWIFKIKMESLFFYKFQNH